MKLEDRVAKVTGASIGIDHAIAEKVGVSIAISTDVSEANEVKSGTSGGIL